MIPKQPNLTATTPPPRQISSTPPNLTPTREAHQWMPDLDETFQVHTINITYFALNDDEIDILKLAAKIRPPQEVLGRTTGVYGNTTKSDSSRTYLG